MQSQFYMESRDGYQHTDREYGMYFQPAYLSDSRAFDPGVSGETPRTQDNNRIISHN